MPLVKCPHCDRSVSNVASTCPHCSKLIAEERWRRSLRGEYIDCHRCRAQIVAESPVCPNCGTIGPKQRVKLLSIPLLAVAAALAVALVGGLNGFERGSAITVAGFQPALAEAEQTPPQAAAVIPSTELIGMHTRWTRTWVNVRAGRGTNTTVVMVLDPGQPITVAAGTGAWRAVYVDGRPVGFVANSELLPRPPSPIASIAERP